MVPPISKLPFLNIMTEVLLMQVPVKEVSHILKTSFKGICFKDGYIFYVCACIWRSEDNVREPSSLSTLWVPELEFRQSPSPTGPGISFLSFKTYGTYFTATWQVNACLQNKKLNK
jgi:hypothetical protein